MANSKSALKRHRQSLRQREHNNFHVTRVRTFSKRVVKAIETGDKETAQANLKTAVKLLDKAASKGAMKKRTASRKISLSST